MKRLKVQKKNLRNTIWLLLLFTFIIILAVMVVTAAAKNSSSQARTGTEEESSESVEEESSENTVEEGGGVLTVLKEIDTNAKTVTLLDTESGQDLILDYNGGTNIVDKYGQVISASQLSVGQLLDAYFDEETSDLEKLQISVNGWVYKGISKWSADTQNKIIKIADTKYKYTDALFITGLDRFLDISDLSEEDELIMGGSGRKVWSVIVSKSHGTLRFEDYADFVGGTVYIGNREILPIVSDMEVTVQEGTYTVIMENEALKGSKTVEIKPLEETVLNMSDFKKSRTQTGLVTFDIKPEGADLYIDGNLKEYEDAVELEYGEHSIKVTLGGYATYTGELDLEESSKTISIYMVEASKNDTKDTQNDGTSTSNTIDGSESSNIDTEDDSDGDTETEDNDDAQAGNNVYIKSPEGASVYFDGTYKGTVPVSFEKKTGTHYITMILSGKIKTYTVEIEDDGKNVIYTFDDLVTSK